MDSAIDVAVVPVAGLGTRLLPATKSQPKEMLPVGRKPVVQYVVEELTRVGITRVLFVTGPGQGVDREPLRRQRRADPDAARERQGGAAGGARVRARDGASTSTRGSASCSGSATPCSCARSFVGNQPFVVALGDSIIGLHAESDVVRRMTALLRRARGGRGDRLRGGAARRGAPLRHRQAARRDGELFELADLVEKPSPREAPSNLAIAARYVLSPAIFDALAQTRRGKGGEIQLTDAIRAVIRDGGRVYGVRLRPDERRFDIGNFETYFRRSSSSRWPTRSTGRARQAASAERRSDAPHS